MLQDLVCTDDKVSFVVLNAPFLAEGLHKLVGLWQRVTRKGWEQVMVHLVLKSTTEPVNNCLWESMPSSDVSSRGDLKLPKIRASDSIVCFHAIVSKAKDNSEELSAGASHDHEKRKGMQE